MIVYALVASDSDFAIDLYPSRSSAEAALREVLEDEPTFESLLSILPLDFSGAEVTGRI